jgi:hypothetical protein
VSAEVDTPVFEAVKQQPERFPTPEGKDLSPLVKQLDQAAVLANNGYVKELKTKNFPDIPKNQLQEIRFVGYTTRIGRLKFITINTKSDAVRIRCQSEIDMLMRKRDKEFEKNYEGLILPPPPPAQAHLEKEKIIIPQPKQDENTSNQFGYL